MSLIVLIGYLVFILGVIFIFIFSKEAQKCYCGAPKCRGYLGKPRKNYSIPFISDDVIEQMVAVNNTEKEKKVRNKINRLQEFSDNTVSCSFLRGRIEYS